MKSITSRHNAAVRVFRDLADDSDPAGTRLLLDGAHLIRDAVDARLEFEGVCVAASKLGRDTEEAVLATRLAERGVDVMTASDQVFTAINPVRTPSGIMAIVRRHSVSAAELCAGPSPFVVVAIDVQDPGNVGAILRVAEAAGATGAFVTGTSANPFSWKALRGSMGSTLRLPVVNGLGVADTQTCLRASGVRTIAAIPRDGENPEQVRWDGGTAILIGGEGPGLSADIVRASDARVTIPMAPHVESLNAAVAAAILLYTARRHRSPG